MSWLVLIEPWNSSSLTVGTLFFREAVMSPTMPAWSTSSASASGVDFGDGILELQPGAGEVAPAIAVQR